MVEARGQLTADVDVAVGDNTLEVVAMQAPSDARGFGERATYFDATGVALARGLALVSSADADVEIDADGRLSVGSRESPRAARCERF